MLKISDKNLKLALHSNTYWYRIDKLAEVLLQIKRQVRFHEFDEFKLIYLLKNCGIKLIDLIATNRFPSGPLEYYVCDEIGLWKSNFNNFFDFLDFFDLLEKCDNMLKNLENYTFRIDRDKFEAMFSLEWDLKEKCYFNNID